MTKIVMVDVQPEKTMDEAIYNLIRFEEVSKGNIGLDMIYKLVNCKSRLVERVWMANLSDNNQLDLICDEEGLFGQWSRGIKIKNSDGYEHTIFGNCLLVKATPDGEWVGWDNESEMIKDIKKHVSSINFFSMKRKDLI